MKLSIFIVVTWMVVAATCIADGLDAEGRKLRNLETVLSVHMKESGGKLPSNLKALRDYINLQELLRPDVDQLGIFSDRYVFLPTKPELVIEGQASRTLLLLSTRPFANGKRGAIWLYSSGEYSSGMIDEKDLQSGLSGIDLSALKPMGGDIPAPTHPFPDAPITEYQAKVMQLAREGKITPEPRKDGTAPKDASNPSPTPTQRVLPEVSPTQATPSIAAREDHASAVERRTALWPWVAAPVLLGFMALLIWKRR